MFEASIRCQVCNVLCKQIHKEKEKERNLVICMLDDTLGMNVENMNYDDELQMLNPQTTQIKDRKRMFILSFNYIFPSYISFEGLGIIIELLQ